MMYSRVLLRNQVLLKPRLFSTMPQFNTTSGASRNRKAIWSAAAGGVVFMTAFVATKISTDTKSTSLDAMISLPLPSKVVPLDTIDTSSFSDTKVEESSFIKEPVTGIQFAPIFDAKKLLGCGVRKKFSFVNVYAVGFYVKPSDFQSLSDDTDACEEALLNPHNHRTIRIVMNRTLTMDQIISALMDALEPRMQGQDLHTLEEFSKLKDYGSMHKGEEILLTLAGDKMTCKCSNGGNGFIQSEVFTKAVCDVYFGKNPISPPAKKSALDGIRRL